ncbi:MAG: hypothetical protein MI755_22320 [Sphingomonadales bacterium]|nr:hypothetical protein [Sphingomonadales bacterium]
MRIESPLADMDFLVGSVVRRGDALVVTSDAASPLEATVLLSDRDAATLFAAVLKSPSALGFVLTLPFRWLRGKSGRPAAGSGARHPFDQLNKPW